MSLNSDLLYLDNHFTNPPSKEKINEISDELIRRLINAASSLNDLKSYEDLSGLSPDFLKSAIGLLIGSMMGASIPQNDGA